MSRRIGPATLLLTIIAVLFGLLGAYAVRQHYRQLPQITAAPKVQKAVIVPMASTELAAGRKITLGDVALFSLTPAQMAEQGISETFMSRPQQIIGRVLRDGVEKGKTFDATQFFPEGTGPGVADMLEPGQRAVTIPVEMDAAVAGFASPGAWVDVLFRSEADEEKEHPETTITLITRVKVLAFNQDTSEGSRSAEDTRRQNQHPAVTLSVDPQQATALQVVDKRGTLSLALRHPDDKELYPGDSPRTLDELLKIPPNERHRMEIYRGPNLTEVEFKQGDRLTPSAIPNNRAVAAHDTPKN